LHSFDVPVVRCGEALGEFSDLDDQIVAEVVVGGAMQAV
jgi:hypothetical protein